MHKWAVESAKMNFAVPDSAPSAKLNEILWKASKGPKSPMPAIRHGVVTGTADDDDDAKPTKKAGRDTDDDARTGRGGR
jgi:hypothetical protein